MTNFGWIITRKQEAQEWQAFANGDVIATEEDVGRLVDGSVKEDQIDEFIIKNNELRHLPDMKLATFRIEMKFKRLYSVTLEKE